MPELKVEIRPARPDDLDRLVELLKELFAIEVDFTFNESLQRRGLQLLEANSSACLLVAKVAGQVMGMCSGQLTISTAEGGPALLVEDVIVDTRYRGRGVGRALLEGLGAWGKGQGAHRLQLLADRHNTAALAFYRRLGWQSTGLICLRKHVC